MARRPSGKPLPRLTPDQQQLVTDNIGLAKWITHRFCNESWIQFDELLPAAYWGLCYAAAHWKPGTAKFANYATQGIKYAIRDELDFLKRQIHLPRRTRQIITTLIGTYGISYFPSREEIVKLIGYKQKLPDWRYRELYLAWLAYKQCPEEEMEL